MNDIGPEAGGAPRQGGAHSCPNCSADMVFDATSQSLKCGHCGATVPIAGAAGQQAIVEYDLASGLAASAATGLGAAVRTLRCQECGASVSFEERVTSTTCEFCGSAQVLPQEQNRNLIRPGSVLPFKVDQAKASSAFKAWISRLWFRPSDLKHRAAVSQMAGVYVPYWTFDAMVHSSWTAQAGYYYYETEHYMDRDSSGKTVHRTRQVRRTRWQPAWGSRQDFYDDVLVCASKGIPDDLKRKLEPFDTHALVPYTPAVLAGWKAEEYAVDLNSAWKMGLERIEASQYQRCGADVPGDTHAALHVTSRYANTTFKHVLLPVWISAFRYGDKVYRFLVNGQTGEVTGKAPWSVAKIVLFILAMLGLVTAIGVIWSLLD